MHIQYGGLRNVFFETKCHIFILKTILKYVKVMKTTSTVYGCLRNSDIRFGSICNTECVKSVFTLQFNRVRLFII